MNDTAELIYSSVSAGGHARQHNGNVYNTNTYHYSLPQQTLDQGSTTSQRNVELLKAAAEGQTRRVDILVQKYGADVDFADEDGLTALHHACLSGFSDTVEGLISKHGADVNAISQNFGTPICLAVFKARVDVLNVMLSGRAQLDSPAGCFGSVLHAAVAGRDVAIVRKVMEQKRHSANMKATIRIDFTHKNGIMQDLGRSIDLFSQVIKQLEIDDCCPVHLACLQGNDDMLEMLIVEYRASAKPRARLTTLRTNGDDCQHLYQEDNIEPLNFALSVGCIYKLLDTGVDIDHRTSLGVTAAMRLSHRGDGYCLESLASRGADLEAADTEGWTALHYASRYGNLTCVRFLCRASKGIDVQSRSGQTPLFLALRNDHIECVDLLLDNTTLPTGEGRTPLMIALDERSFKVIELLLDRMEAREDPYVIEMKSLMLTRAVLFQDLEMVEKIIALGADVHMLDDQGRSVFETARLTKNDLILQRLHMEAEMDYPLLESLFTAFERLRLPKPETIVEDDNLAFRYLGARLRVALKERLIRSLHN